MVVCPVPKVLQQLHATGGRPIACHPPLHYWLPRCCSLSLVALLTVFPLPVILFPLPDVSLLAGRRSSRHQQSYQSRWGICATQRASERRHERQYDKNALGGTGEEVMTVASGLRDVDRVMFDDCDTLRQASLTGQGTLLFF